MQIALQDRIPTHPAQLPAIAVSQERFLLLCVQRMYLFAYNVTLDRTAAVLVPLSVQIAQSDHMQIQQDLLSATIVC